MVPLFSGVVPCAMCDVMCDVRCDVRPWLCRDRPAARDGISLLLAPFASVLGPESPERSRRNARETSHLASEAALAAEQ